MATIERILCPVDFSETSRHALEHAAAIARWYKASVLALHVYRPMFMPVPGLPSPEDRPSDGDLAQARAETAAFVERAGARGAEVLVEIGQPAKRIVDRAAALPASLIVMGTHGASGFEHLVLGSVTEAVLRRARCPVLTVPARVRAVSTLPFRQVLCAVDFSDSSLSAVGLALSLAQEARSAITFLHVIEWPWEEPPPPAFLELPREQAAALAEFRVYLEKSAMDRLGSLAPAAARQSLATSSRVAHGKAYVEILRVAAEEGADLIVMGVHGRNTADLLLFGSTTNQVVRRAACPVLTLRR